MANIKSAKKRNRQMKKRTDRNRSRLNRIRTFVRRVETAIAEGNKAHAETAFRAAMPELHRGVTKKALRKGTASRKLSRLSARIRSL